MKANEFVKQEGLEEAKFLIDEWDGEATHWSIDDGFVWVGRSIDTHMLCIETLKRLVESHELIKRFHGVEKAKYELKLIEDGSIFRCCVAITAEMLKQAIADVEACQ